jgi:prevent-host-death family protein
MSAKGSSRVGVRTLKNSTSEVLRRVRRGEVVTITDRDEPIARLVPIERTETEAAVRRLSAEGRVSWSGGKPTGASHPPSTAKSPVADAVVEDRR